MVTEMAAARLRTLLDTLKTPRGRIALTIACLGALFFGFWHLHSGTGWFWGSDFRVFYFAAEAVRHGADPYTAVIAWIHTYSPTTHLGTTFATKSYVYGPFFALLLTPLSLLPNLWAMVIWNLCNLVFLTAAMYCLLRIAGISPSRLHVLVLAAAAVVTLPVQTEFFLGQSDIFVLFCICAAFYLLLEGGPVTGGILLAMGCATKPTLLVLVIFMLWKREWKFAATAILGFLALFLGPFLWLGGQAWHDLMTIWSFWSSQYIAYARNDSPRGVLTRIFTTNPVVRPLFVAPWLAYALWLALAVVVVVVTAALVSPRRLERGPRGLLEIGLAVTAMLLISPLTEWPYLMLLFIPLMGCYAWLRGVDWRARPWRAVAIGAFLVWVGLLGPLKLIEYFIWDHIGNRPILTDVLVVLAPMHLYALIALFALQLYTQRLITGRATAEATRAWVIALPAMLVAWLTDLAVALARLGHTSRQRALDVASWSSKALARR